MATELGLCGGDNGSRNVLASCAPSSAFYKMLYSNKTSKTLRLMSSVGKSYFSNNEVYDGALAPRSLRGVTSVLLHS
ncbi:hypothetical protein RR46_04064 [Papilio xuthus]|uniref:Uncharacterized protein n=1 Tax=Papilio xuthus TaxID=66420 RepID=A0A194QHC5_PAPXU|nr:hypothetical protein RR46_04064 [Papilio xuthus]